MINVLKINCGLIPTALTTLTPIFRVMPPPPFPPHTSRRDETVSFLLVGAFRHLVCRGPFLKSSYERFLLYEFVEPVLSYRSYEFVALTNLCETGPWVSKTSSYALLRPTDATKTDGFQQ